MKTKPPVEEGDEIEVTIESIGEQGDGIARHHGFVIITPETNIEETVKVKITKVFNKYAFAKRIEE